MHLRCAEPTLEKAARPYTSLPCMQCAQPFEHWVGRVATAHLMLEVFAQAVRRCRLTRHSASRIEN